MSKGFDEFTKRQKHTAVTVKMFDDNNFFKSNLVKLKKVQYCSSEEDEEDNRGYILGVIVNNKINETLVVLFSDEIKTIYDSSNNLIWENC
ncbi:MAG: hypothetical protein ABIP06_13905 [Pyrinomonadaceae bacterium]